MTDPKLIHCVFCKQLLAGVYDRSTISYERNVPHNHRTESEIVLECPKCRARLTYDLRFQIFTSIGKYDSDSESVAPAAAPKEDYRWEDRLMAAEQIAGMPDAPGAIKVHQSFVGGPADGERHSVVPGRRAVCIRDHLYVLASIGQRNEKQGWAFYASVDMTMDEACKHMVSHYGRQAIAGAEYMEAGAFRIMELAASILNGDISSMGDLHGRLVAIETEAETILEQVTHGQA